MKALRRLRPPNKVPAWKRKKLEQQNSNRDVAKAKWLHHCVKGIHKALKLAKQFEIKKVSRRIVQAKQPNASEIAARDSLASLPKLEQQLQTLKAIDLDMLAKQAAAQAGFADSPAAAAGSSANIEDVVGQRLLGASCVVKQLEASGKDFSKKFGGGEQPQAPAAASSEDGADVASMSEGSDDSSFETDEDGAGTTGPIELDDAAAAALEKLRSARSALPTASGSDESSGAISLPSVSISGSDDEYDVGVTSQPVGSKRKREASAKGAAKGAAKGPPAKRMGQRARRQLYEQMYGLQAKHLAKQMQLAQASVLPPQPNMQYPGPPPDEQQQQQQQQPDAAPAAVGESLHPSWEAKRQQKAALAAAGQAKKVVFGEDDSGEPVVINPAPPAKAKAAQPAGGDTVKAKSGNRGGHMAGAGRSSSSAPSVQGRGGHGPPVSAGFGRGGGRMPGLGRGGRSAGFDSGRGGRGGRSSSGLMQRGRDSGRGAGSRGSAGRDGAGHGDAGRSDAGRGGAGRSGRAPGTGSGSAGRGRGDAGFIPVAEMHPSWQAKKLQAAAQPAGKKVVFSDD